MHSTNPNFIGLDSQLQNSSYYSRDENMFTDVLLVWKQIGESVLKKVAVAVEENQDEC